MAARHSPLFLLLATVALMAPAVCANAQEAAVEAPVELVGPVAPAIIVKEKRDPAVVSADQMAAEIGEQSVSQAKTLMHRAGDAGEGRNLKDSLKLTYDFNPEIKAARAEVRRVAEDLPQALANFKPNASINGDVTYSDIDLSGGNAAALAAAGDGSNTSKTAGVSVSQPLFRGGRSIAETRAAQDALAAGVADYKTSVQNVLVQAVAAHVDLMAKAALVELNAQNLERLGKQLEAARARFEFGEFTRTDVAQAEARYADAEAANLRANGDLRTAKAEYRRLTGQEPVDLTFPDTIPSLPSSVADGLEMAWKYNPELQSARYRSAAANNGINVVRGERLPTVSAQAGYEKIYDPQPGTFNRQDTSVIGVRASMPLYTGGATVARIRQQKQLATRFEAMEQDAIERTRLNVLSAWEDYQTVKAQLAAREKQLAAAALANESIKQENEVGQRTLIDVLDAEQELLAAQVSMIDAQRNEIVFAYTLASSIGLLHPKAMGLDPDYADAAKIISQYKRDVAGFGFGVDE